MFFFLTTHIVKTIIHFLKIPICVDVACRSSGAACWGEGVYFWIISRNNDKWLMAWRPDGVGLEIRCWFGFWMKCLKTVVKCEYIGYFLQSTTSLQSYDLIAMWYYNLIHTADNQSVYHLFDQLFTQTSARNARISGCAFKNIWSEICPKSLKC